MPAPKLRMSRDEKLRMQQSRTAAAAVRGRPSLAAGGGRLMRLRSLGGAAREDRFSEGSSQGESSQEEGSSPEGSRADSPLPSPPPSPPDSAAPDEPLSFLRAGSSIVVVAESGDESDAPRDEPLSFLRAGSSIVVVAESGDESEALPAALAKPSTSNRPREHAAKQVAASAAPPKAPPWLEP